MAPGASNLHNALLRSSVEWLCLIGAPYCSIRYTRAALVAAISGTILVATKTFWRYYLVWGWRRAPELRLRVPAQQRLREYFTQMIAENKGDGCGILLVDSPSGRFEMAVGRLSSWSSKEAGADTRFEIASVTKMMVSYEVLRLSSKGLLSLDSAVCDLIALDGLGDVTVRQLLTHTSGLPDFWQDGPEYPLKSLIAALERPPLFTRPLSRIWFNIAVALLGKVVKLNTFTSKAIAEPLLLRSGGERIWNPWEVLRIALRSYRIRSPGQFHYADTNYLVLGVLLEEIHQMALHEILAQEIFTPLNMKDTYMRYDYRGQTDFGAQDTALSTRYCRQGFLGRFAWTFPDWTLSPLPILTIPTRFVSADWASGGAVTTANDLCRFMRACVSDHKYWKVLTESFPSRTDVRQYGFGIEVVGLGKHGRLLGHTGNGGACLYYWPEQDVVFAGTTNGQVIHSRDIIKQMIHNECVLACLSVGSEEHHPVRSVR